MREEMKKLMIEVIQRTAKALHTRLEGRDEIYQLEIIRSYAPLLESLGKTLKQVENDGKAASRR